MKRIVKIFLLTLVLIAPAAFGATSIWNVTNGETNILLAGDRYFSIGSELPAEINQALKASDLIMILPHPMTAGRRAFKDDWFSEFHYTSPDSLWDALDPKVAKLLVNWLESSGLLELQLNTYKPGYAFFALQYPPQFDYEYGYTEQPEFAMTTLLRGVKIMDLGAETLEFMRSIENGPIDELFVHSVYINYALRGFTPHLVKAWDNGDVQMLEELLVEPYRRDFPEAYKFHVVGSVTRIKPAVEKLFESEEKEFVVIDSLYLVGEHGLLKQLAREGYTVEYFGTTGTPAISPEN